MKKTKEKQEWQVEWRDVNSITPYANNARKNDDTVPYLINSIKRFGFRVPLVIDKDGVIVCGHTRLKAALQIGMERVPCVRADDLTKAEIKAFRLADNKIAEMSEWDFGKLDVELEELKIDFDDDMTDFGFEWGDEETDKEGETEEDAVPETDDNNTVSRRGCVYQLGEHRLMCGDSTNADDVAKLMAGEKADLCLTDPPYSMETQGGGILGNAKSMKEIRNNKVDSFNPSVLVNYAPTNIYFHNKPLIKSYILLAERDGLNYDLAIYKKRGLPNYNAHLMTDIEYIAIIGKQAPEKGLEMSFYSKVFEGNKDIDNKLSYSKPVAICDKFIRLYSQPNKIILDIFGGSGTTLIACEKINRKCRMMELDEHYCDVIRKRWAEYVHGEGCNWEELTPETN